MSTLTSIATLESQALQRLSITRLRLNKDAVHFISCFHLNLNDVLVVTVSTSRRFQSINLKNEAAAELISQRPSISAMIV